jgi:hypothetical protein
MARYDSEKYGQAAGPVLQELTAEGVESRIENPRQSSTREQAHETISSIIGTSFAAAIPGLV